MSKRAKEKAELIANGIMISVQGKTGRVVYNTKEKSFTHYELMCAAQKGYEQAEKDIEALILKFLDSCDDRDYATVWWIKKNFGEYKKKIMEEKA